MVIDKDINEQIKWAQINADVLRSMENPRKAYWITFFICIAMVASRENCAENPCTRGG